MLKDFTSIFKKSQQDKVDKKTQNKAIEMAAVLGLTGPVQHFDKSAKLLTWFDSISKQFFMALEKNGEQLSCLGMTNDSQGAWIWKTHKDPKNLVKEIGYLPATSIDQMDELFSGHVLLKDQAEKLHEMQWMPMISFDTLKAVNPSANGELEAETRGGLILNISMQSDGFQIVVLGVTSERVQSYYQKDIWNIEQLKAFLKPYATLFLYPSIMEIFADEQDQIWHYYQSTLEKTYQEIIILNDPHKVNKYQYLGFSSTNSLIFFNSEEIEFANTLLFHPVNDEVGLVLTGLVIPGGKYQRKGDLLIFNMDGISGVTTLSKSAYLQIDEMTLLIATTLAQSGGNALTFTLTLFTYPIVYISHKGNGLLLCKIGNCAEVSITRKDEELWLLTGEQILIVVDAFDASSNAMNTRLKINWASNYYSVYDLTTRYVAKFGRFEQDAATPPTLTDLFNQEGWGLWGNTFFQ